MVVRSGVLWCIKDIDCVVPTQGVQGRKDVSDSLNMIVYSKPCVKLHTILASYLDTQLHADTQLVMLVVGQFIE